MTVFDEIEHVCQANDTYESISKKYYMSPKFAQALQRHNQNHSRASREMATTGKLTPGEKIYVPQAGILEARYTDAIPMPAPGVVPASGTAAPPAPPPNP